MGFNYELLKSFTDHLGIDLEMITEKHIDHAMNLLNSGEADVLAFGLTVSSTRKKEIVFSDPIAETRQVLVQRKPHNWRSMTEDAIDSRIVRNQIDLAGKTIYVQTGSAHLERLKALANEIGDSINVIDTPVSFAQNIAWGLPRNNSGQLLRKLNNWIKEYRNTGSYALLYAKYFRNSRSGTIVRSDYYYLTTGKISQYDDLIKKASSRISWDWRLLASLICQESRFDANVESRMGAYGLMQVMPMTGRNFNIDITASPSNNILAGTTYLNWLKSIFDSKVTDPEERVKFILASYNAGPGHVLDAMKLAEKNGMNPQKWDGSVAVWLLKKSEPRYFTDSVVKNGYFKGTESVNFVSEVLERYDHYRNIIPGEESIGMLSKAETSGSPVH